MILKTQNPQKTNLLIRRNVPFQPRRNVFFLAVLYVTEAHRALAVVDPERTFLRQVHLVVAEEVFDENAAQPRVDFHVVVVVYGVHVAAAIVDGALQLGKGPEKCTKIIRNID